jgi:hypothetical protein
LNGSSTLIDRFDDVQLGREDRDVEAISGQRMERQQVSRPATPPPAITTRGPWP